MEQLLNFWDLHWFLYILGYLFFPRITLLVIFFSYDVVLGSLAHPVLAVLGWFFLPRLVLGITALYFLSPENNVLAWIAIVLSFFISGGEAHATSSRRR